MGANKKAIASRFIVQDGPDDLIKLFVVTGNLPLDHFRPRDFNGRRRQDTIKVLSVTQRGGVNLRMLRPGDLATLQRGLDVRVEFVIRG